jgi:hypothetical protein
LVQAFLKKCWVESDFKAPNLPLSLRLKGSRASSFLHYFSNLLMSVESVFSNLALSFVLKEVKEFALPLIFMSNALK